MSNNVLSHHGIKGQQWGVKNGPPYPLSESDKSSKEKKLEHPGRYNEGHDFTLSKGTSLYRGTRDPNEPLDSKRKYATFQQKDREIYMACADEADFRFTHEMEMTPLKDVKVAGYIESTKAILNAYGKQSVSELIETYDDARNLYYDDVLTNQMVRLNRKTKFSDAVFKELSEKGYDAMVDIEDTFWETKMPLIVLNPSDSMSIIDVREVDDAKIDINVKKLMGIK